MKLLPILTIVFIFSFISCSNDDELAWVSLLNDTNYNLEVVFFQSKDANGYKLQASLDPFDDNQVDMYHDTDESIDPDFLLSLGYDSLIVRVNDLKGTVIYFGKNSTPNYAFNPFKESEPWEYEEISADFPTKTSPNTQYIHNHLLVIDMEKVIVPDPDAAEFDGLTWAFVKGSEENDLVLDGVLASYTDILGYDTVSHTYQLGAEVSEQINAYSHPTSGIRFAVTLEGEILFLAYFVPAYSSQGFPDKVCVEPYSPDNKFRFNLGYPAPDYEGEDPRNDARILARLELDGKLVTL